MTEADKKKTTLVKDKSAISLITILASCFAWIQSMYSSIYELRLSYLGKKKKQQNGGDGTVATTKQSPIRWKNPLTFFFFLFFLEFSSFYDKKTPCETWLCIGPRVSSLKLLRDVFISFFFIREISTRKFSCEVACKTNKHTLTRQLCHKRRR